VNRFQLTVTPPGGNPIRKAPTLTQEVSAYQAMVILMNADPAVAVAEPVDYPTAREFGRGLSRAPSRYEVRDRQTGITFMIERTN
jgi:hypothetical protein